MSAHDVYRGAVSVMMRIVFLLFAEERRLLPSDNELYANCLLGRPAVRRAGSSGRWRAARTSWNTRTAPGTGCSPCSTPCTTGSTTRGCACTAHDGSLFDPKAYPWLPLTIDDRTVLHMLRAVQYVEIGTGKSRNGGR